MKPARVFIRTAFKTIWRGGQRNFVAFLCVVFGVMSLVSMNTLAQSIQQMLTLKPYELIGGDLTLDRVNEDSISADEEAEIQKLQADGTISDYTLIDYTTSLAFHFLNSGELIYPSYGMGVDPQKYPLAGKLTIPSAQNMDLEHLLVDVGDVIVTKDLALNENLKVGDRIVLSDLDHGASIPATIKAIASDTPNHQGSKIYFSHQTAQVLMGHQRTSNTVLVNSADPNHAQTILEDQGWRVFTAQQLANSTAASQGVLAMGVNDIGLLGLLVGAIGIANTMQVLLKRRRKEVAIWKTLGYTTRQIEKMFLFEAGILGAGGSLIGVGMGVLLSRLITSVFSRVTTVLVIPRPSLVVAISGFVIGTLITMVFALWAIISTSQVLPSALLRQDSLDKANMPKWKLSVLAVLVGGVFALVAAWVLKSVFTGIIVLVVSILLLWIIGLVLLGLMRLVLKIFPMKHWPLAKIARNNLRKRSTSLIMAMIALFIGVVMLTIGTVITQSGSNTISELKTPGNAQNLAVYVSADQESSVKAALATLGLESDSVDHRYATVRIILPGQRQDSISSMITSRSDAGAYSLTGKAWNSQPDAAYIPEYSDAKIGDQIQVTTMDNQQVNLTVAGTYSAGSNINWPGSLDGILVSEETAQLLGSPASSQIFLTIGDKVLEKEAALLEKALPQATIISMPDYQAHFLRIYENLFWFIAVMAGLAVLAGLLLVANSVNLTMIERRYDIGVYKSLGYSQGQVLFTQVLEYGLMSFVVSLLGLGSIWILVIFAKMAAGPLGSYIVLKPLTAVVILMFTVGLTAIVVVASCWNPSRISPVLTFNDRE
jgi:putative ABC transport system permease protein